MFGAILKQLVSMDRGGILGDIWEAIEKAKMSVVDKVSYFLI